MSGARALGYLGLFQVTRRKGGTLSGRYRSNGYVHPQNNHRLTQSHRRNTARTKLAPTGIFSGHKSRVNPRTRTENNYTGNRNSAHNPPPSRLLKVNDPPIATASCWAIASPSPVPPVLRLREFSTR